MLAFSGTACLAFTAAPSTPTCFVGSAGPPGLDREAVLQQFSGTAGLASLNVAARKSSYRRPSHLTPSP